MEDESAENPVQKLLDAALQRYSEFEPRPGLEGRVLANLQAERERLDTRVSWGAALAAIAVVGILGVTIVLIRRPDVGPQAAKTHAATSVIAKETVITVRSIPHSDPARGYSPGTRRRSARAVALAENAPKLEQFPSPRPLSEQEEMLARYVRERPQEAQLLARAQAELLQQDLLEFDQRNGTTEVPDSTR
jgi:hypothetical protein